MVLTQRAFIATVWSGADFAIRQGVQFAAAVILARLVTPAEFGMIAALYLFTGVAWTIADGGLSSALIQQQQTTREEESTVFWFNAAVGAAVTVALFAAGGSIAAFYAVPALKNLTRAVALTVFITALGSVHTALLTRRTDFKALMKVTTGATLVSAAIAIVMAWRGLGVWALAGQALSFSIVSTLLLWAIDPWRPSLQFSGAAMRRLGRFGAYVMISGLLDVAYTRGAMVLIGRFKNVREAGFYDRAEATKQLPLSTMSAIFSRVALPLFSAAAGDRERLRRGTRRSIGLLMLINVPIMLALAAAADTAVMTVFGPAWMPAVPLLRILALSGILWPLHVVNLNVLLAQGYPNLYFRAEVLKKIAGIALLIAAIRYGALGIAWSQVVLGVLAFVINAYYTRVHLDYGPLRQVGDVAGIAVVSSIMAFAMYTVGRSVALPAPAVLALQLGAGGVVLLAACALFRISAYVELLGLVFASRRSGNA